MTDIKVITPSDLDGVSLVIDTKGKVVARATATTHEFLDPDGLDWKPYPKASVNGKTAMITRWDFKNTYKDPFVTSMTVDNQGIADGVPSMYLTNLTPSGVDIIAVFKADGSGNEQRWEVSYKVEEADVSGVATSTNILDLLKPHLEDTPLSIDEYGKLQIDMSRAIMPIAGVGGTGIDKGPFKLEIGDQVFEVKGLAQLVGTEYYALYVE